MTSAPARRNSRCSSRSASGASRTTSGTYGPALMYPRRSSSKTWPSAPSTGPLFSRSRMPRWLLAGTADLKTLGGETRDVLDGSRFESEFHQGPPDERAEFVAGAAPAGANRAARQAGDWSEDEVVICHQIIRALVRALDVDDPRIRELRHAFVDEALHAGDGGDLGAHVGRIVVADLHARCFAFQQRMAVDAHVEVGEDGQPARREHPALVGGRDEVLRLARPVGSEWKAEIAAVAPGEQRISAQAGRQDETGGQPLTGGGVNRDPALPAVDPVDRRVLRDPHARRPEARQQCRRDRRNVEESCLDVEPAEVDVELWKAGAEPVAIKGLRVEVQAPKDAGALLGVG